MNAQNTPKDKQSVSVDQTNASTISNTPPAEPNLEDMELNEEQLDIISGGGDGNKLIIG
ncbi:hypothetical protein [Rudanella paleaurantiibacter]|uniref:hypothetical protein n=1 Tax=Rudanella paleaurantiibacter TaxID=2614655 RepID=UPI001628F10B|nr:hypothetical protein [Rudanella paleaurantiibacter]